MSRALNMMVFPLIIVLVTGFFGFFYGSCTATSNPSCDINLVDFIVQNPLSYLTGANGGIYGMINHFGLNVAYQGESPDVGTCNRALTWFGNCNTVDLTGIFMTFLGLAAGIIMFIVGLGITVSAQVAASGGSFGVNDQGSRQMMAWGIGLILYFWFQGWADILWYGSFSLPYNLGTAIWGILTIVYAFGLYELGRTVT